MRFEGEMLEELGDFFHVAKLGPFLDFSSARWPEMTKDTLSSVAPISGSFLDWKML